MDFVSDSLANGRRIKCLTVADDFSHECVDIATDYGIGGQYVTRLLDRAPSSAAIRRGTHRQRAGIHQPRLHGLGAGHGIRHLLNDPAARCRTATSRASTASSATNA